ncbi:MAG: 3-dehydroquinate synthase [Bryobacteraceae bacterium]
MNTQSIQGTIELHLQYTVHFTRGVFSADNTLLRDTVARGGRVPAKILLVVDRGLSQASPELIDAIESYCRTHMDVLQLARSPILVPGGEAVKNSPLYTQMMQEAVSQFGICRHSYIIGVGGGAVLDMVGYAAATSHRGVRLIRIPTTVLSQNDSGVGVKNGINAFSKKNFLGTFAPAVAILNDFDFLHTLSERDWRSGMAEAVKVALIKDAVFFEILEGNARALAHRKMPAMEQLIHRCAELHIQHISRAGDPFESGSSRPLDFGHWSAHKLEQFAGFELRHGEAVAIGIALDSTYSWLKGKLPEADWNRILRLLDSLGFALHIPELERPDLLEGLSEFREHLGGELCITLLEGIGRGIEVHNIDEQIMTAAIRHLRQFAAGAMMLRRKV